MGRNVSLCYITSLTIFYVGLAANPLPQPMGNAAVVPFGDSFLLVGGDTISGSPDHPKLSTIYRYNSKDDSWTLIEAALSEPKYNVTAMLVERKIIHAIPSRQMDQY